MRSYFTSLFEKASIHGRCFIEALWHISLRSIEGRRFEKEHFSADANMRDALRESAN